MDATLSLLNLAGRNRSAPLGRPHGGVQRAFGSDLRRFLARALDNRRASEPSHNRCVFDGKTCY
jgi:hypothetical protein